MGRALVVASVLWLVPWAGLSPEANEPAPAAELAVQHFLTAPDEPLRQYRAIRHFEGGNGRFNVAATMTVLTELAPDTGFTYTVLEEQGSEYVRNRVLRSMLETERKMLTAGDPARFAFSDENYDMSEWHPSDAGLVRLLVKPRRREAGLIDGSLLISTDTGDLLRVEGRFAKNPSFWTTRVEFVREYARIAGVRVPVRMESTANVRMAGVSTLSMVYDYEMVNGTPVE